MMTDMTDLRIALTIMGLCLVCSIAAGFTAFRIGVVSTTEAAQRAATLAGAAKWGVNKETGAPEFTWTQCTALGVTR